MAASKGIIPNPGIHATRAFNLHLALPNTVHTPNIFWRELLLMLNTGTWTRSAAILGDEHYGTG